MAFPVHSASCSKYPRGGGTVREQFENSSRVGHGKEGGGNEFELSSSSRPLGVLFFGRGSLQFISSSRSGAGVTVCRIQLAVSLKANPEWGTKRKGGGNDFEFSSSSRSLGVLFLQEGEASVHFEFALVSGVNSS